MKPLFILIFIIPLFVNSQEKSWHHLDPIDNAVLRINTIKACQFLESRNPDTVIVVVIENGVELTHEGLKRKY